MKNLLTILVFVVLAVHVIGCATEPQKFKQVVPVNINNTIEVDIQSETSYGPVLYNRYDLFSSFDFPKGYRVTNVFIESISGTITPLTTNSATGFHSSSTIIRPSTTLGEPVAIWDTNTSVFVPISSNETEFGLVSSLLPDGITELKEQLYDIISDPWSPDRLSLQINIAPVSNTRLVAELNIQIKATIEYEYCQDVLVYPLMDPGEKCD